MYQVIIVEDDPMVLSINRQYVEVTPGFTVVRTFANGPSALEYLKKHTVDLILLDYYMPGMNGMEFIDALHSVGRAPAVIMVTSASESDTVRALVRRGVVDYLVKPFEYTRFKAALERFAVTRQALTQSKPVMDQSSIDQLFAIQGTPSITSEAPAKGLNETTLSNVREFFRAHPGASYTSEQIAEQLGLSRITIRRYVNYLVDINEIVSAIDYKTGGRPSITYICR